MNALFFYSRSVTTGLQTGEFLMKAWNHLHAWAEEFFSLPRETIEKRGKARIEHEKSRR
jgi:hypothetical protein